MNEQEIRNDWYTALLTENRISAKIKWGFTTQDLLVLLCYHKAGLFREKIEDLLEDCNFHTECCLLFDKEYDKCLSVIVEDITP